MASQRARLFKVAMTESTRDIGHIMAGVNEQVKKSNREKLASVVKTILFLGRNNLPLRGHRDTGDLLVDKEESGRRQEGVFRDLLRFRVDAGDNQLADYTHGSSERTQLLQHNTKRSHFMYWRGYVFQTGGKY